MIHKISYDLVQLAFYSRVHLYRRFSLLDLSKLTPCKLFRIIQIRGEDDFQLIIKLVYKIFK